jgi:hypothetical protein
MAQHRMALIIGITIAGFLGLILLWAGSARDPSASVALTEVTDKAAIQTHVELAHISIATGENYVGHKIRVISGYLKNVSDKPIRLIETKMVFMDWDGKPIQESTEKVFAASQKPLLPGTQHRFEVNFENLPRTWNYHIPTVEIVKVAF